MNGYTIGMDWTLTIGSLSFGIIDIVSLAIILIGAVSGCITGFGRAAGSNLGFLLSFPLALLFTSPVAGLISDRIGLPILWSSVLAFATIAAVIYIVISLLGNMIEDVLEGIGLEVVNSILGFVWGLVSTSLVMSLIIAILAYQPFLDISRLTDSSLIVSSIIKPLFPSFLDILKGVSL